MIEKAVDSKGWEVALDKSKWNLYSKNAFAQKQTKTDHTCVYNEVFSC